MQTCPKCSYTENLLQWYKKGNNYYANSKRENVKYKIEKEENVYWFYNEGAKVKRKILPVCFQVYIFEIEWGSYGGHLTLEKAKEYCQNYEENNN
jgi:hypothetical protein